MNTYIRDQQLEIAKIGAYRCYAYRNGSQTVNAGASNVLTLDSEVYDPSAMHSTSVNTERITVPAAGLYHIFASSDVSNNNNGTATLHLRKNGSILTPQVTASFVTAASNFEEQVFKLQATLSLAASDYVDLVGQSVTNNFAFANTQLIVVGFAAVV